MNKRLLLGTALNKTGINYFFRKLHNNIIVINYHRISNSNHHTDFDGDVFEHSVDIFREQISWLKRNFDIIDQQTLIDLSKSKEFKLKRNTILITFDDGYVDNYTLAYPILKELEVPAIFFVPYALINERKVGWWDNISWLVGKTQLQKINFKGIELKFMTDADRSDSARVLHNYLKLNPYTETKTTVDDISNVLCIDLPSVERQGEELMTWKQLIEVSNNGVDIGSHSISHRLLSQISYEEQAWEIKQSKVLIEEKLGKKVEAIAYPVGQKTSFNQVTKGLAREAGYKLGFSFYPGSYHNCIDDLYDVRRIALSENNNLYKNEIVFPEIFFSKS